MMLAKVGHSLDRLRAYCEKENFLGWDPYDGLNSKVFQSLPLIKSNRLARLIWIQSFKRNPLNLRRIFLVQKGYNAKGLGLFLNGYCNLYKLEPRDEYLKQIRMLADKVLELTSKGYSGACWGYNFDWQAKAFYQPKNTPTIVASTFIGYALLDAYEILGDDALLESASSISDFILQDLNRTYDKEGDFAFSYSPLDHSQVYNATLLGSRMLARLYSFTKNESLLQEAKKSVEFVIKKQQSDGSWTYSPLPFHSWIDSFHTGYNLECLSEYQHYSGETDYQSHIRKGFHYYINHFFESDGKCKYYNNSLYPIDVHAPAQLIITLSRLHIMSDHQELADRVLNWVIDHMQDSRGYFYFQKKKGFKSKIPYIRWAQGWMFYAMSTYLLERKEIDNEIINN